MGAPCSCTSKKQNPRQNAYDQWPSIQSNLDQQAKENIQLLQSSPNEQSKGKEQQSFILNNNEAQVNQQMNQQSTKFTTPTKSIAKPSTAQIFEKQYQETKETEQLLLPPDTAENPQNQVVSKQIEFTPEKASQLQVLLTPEKKKKQTEQKQFDDYFERIPIEENQFNELNRFINREQYQQNEEIEEYIEAHDLHLEEDQKSQQEQQNIQEIINDTMESVNYKPLNNLNNQVIIESQQQNISSQKKRLIQYLPEEIEKIVNFKFLDYNFDIDSKQNLDNFTNKLQEISRNRVYFSLKDENQAVQLHQYQDLFSFLINCYQALTQDELFSTDLKTKIQQYLEKVTIQCADYISLQIKTFEISQAKQEIAEICQQLYMVLKFYQNAEFLRDFVLKLKIAQTKVYNFILNSLFENSMNHYIADKQKRQEILNFTFHLCSNNTILYYFFNHCKYFIDQTVHYETGQQFTESTLLGTILNYPFASKKTNLYYFQFLETMRFFLEKFEKQMFNWFNVFLYKDKLNKVFLSHTSDTFLKNFLRIIFMFLFHKNSNQYRIEFIQPVQLIEVYCARQKLLNNEEKLIITGIQHFFNNEGIPQYDVNDKNTIFKLKQWTNQPIQNLYSKIVTFENQEQLKLFAQNTTSFSDLLSLPNLLTIFARFVNGMFSQSISSPSRSEQHKRNLFHNFDDSFNESDTNPQSLLFGKEESQAFGMQSLEFKNKQTVIEKIWIEELGINVRINRFQDIYQYRKQMEIYDQVERLGDGVGKRVQIPNVLRDILVGEQVIVTEAGLYTMQEILKYRKRYSEGQIIQIFSEISETLAIAEKEGIVHRDLTMEKFIFDGKRVKIVEWGIALQVNGECEMVKAGTPLFNAPELRIIPKILDPFKCDVFSLGICILIAIGFSARQIYQPIRQELTQQKILKALSQSYPNVSEILESMLYLNQIYRYNFQEVYEAFQQLKQRRLNIDYIQEDEKLYKELSHESMIKWESNIFRESLYSKNQQKIEQYLKLLKLNEKYSLLFEFSNGLSSSLSIHKILTELLGDYSEQNFEVAENYENTAKNYFMLGNYKESKVYIEKAKKIIELFYNKHQSYSISKKINIQFAYAECLNTLSVISSVQDNPEQLNILKKSYSIWLELLGPNNNYLAISLFNQGMTYLKENQLEIAQIVLQKCLEIWNLLYEESKQTNYLVNIAICNRAFGIFFTTKQEEQKALKKFNQSIQLFTKVFGNHHIQIIITQLLIANCLKNQQKFDQAKQQILSAEISLKNLSNKNDYSRIQQFILELKTSMRQNETEILHNNFMQNESNYYENQNKEIVLSEILQQVKQYRENNDEHNAIIYLISKLETAYYKLNKSPISQNKFISLVITSDSFDKQELQNQFKKSIQPIDSAQEDYNNFYQICVLLLNFLENEQYDKLAIEYRILWQGIWIYQKFEEDYYKYEIEIQSNWPVFLQPIAAKVLYQELEYKAIQMLITIKNSVNYQL